MANCKELHKEGTPEYEACVEQNKIEKENEKVSNEIKLEEVIVEAPKVDKPQELISEKKPAKVKVPKIKEEKKEKEDLNYEDNELKSFDVPTEEPSFWNYLSDYLKTPTAVKIATIPIVDKIAQSVTKKQNKIELEKIELDGDGLNNVSIDDPSYILTEDQAAYDPTFVKIGKTISSVNLLELEDYESKKIADLAVKNLAIQYNKTDVTGKPFDPTVWDVYFETTRILQRASLHFEKDNTPVDALATSIGIDKNNSFVDMMSNFYKAARSGLLTSETIDPISDMVYGDAEVKSEGLAEYYRINAERLKLNSTSDAVKKYESRKKELGGGGWAELRAMSENPEAAFSMAIESTALNAGNFLNSQTARDNAIENTKQIGALAAVTLRNPYAIAASLAGSFLAGGIQIMERSLTADRILKAELAKPENGGISINELSEEDMLDLLGDKKFMENVIKNSENRGTVTNATILIATWASYATGAALRKRGVGILKTLLALTGVGVATEATGEIARIMGEDGKPFSKEGQEQIVQEAVLGPLSPGSVVGTTTSLIQGTQESIVGRKATDIAKNSMFPNLIDVFKQQTAAGVEIIKAGFSSNQLTKYLNGLKFNNKITKKQQSQIELNFQNLQKNISKLENVSKDMNLSNDDIAYLSDLLTKISANNKIIKSFTKDAPGMSVKFELENDKLNKDLAKFFEEKSKLTTEGLTLDEVVVTADSKKVEGTQANKIKELWNKEGVKAADKINKNVAITSKIDKILNIYRNRPDFKKYREDIKIALLNDPTYGVLGSLLTFDEARNPNLLSHIIGRLNLKHPDIVNAILPSGEGASFSESIDTGGFEGKGLDVKDDNTIETEEGIDIETEEKNVQNTAINKLRNITGITIEETEEAVNKIIKGNIRTEPTKGKLDSGKRDVTKLSELQLGDKVIEAMGGVLGAKDNKLGNYITFLENQGEDILTVLSSDDVNEIKNTKLSALYLPKKVDRASDGGPGKGIFEYENETPTVQDLITWAADDSLGSTTKIARQRTLANILGGLIGRVSTAETVRPLESGETSEGGKKLIETQDLLGVKMTPDKLAAFISDIQIRIDSLEKTRKEKYAGRLGINDIPAMANKSLILALKLFKKALSNGSTWIQALGTMLRDLAKRKVDSKEIETVKGIFQTYLTPEQLSGIKPISAEQLQKAIEIAKIEGKMINNGDAYEAAIIKILLGLEKKIPGLEIVTRGKQKNNLAGADVEMVINGIPLNVELKAIFSANGNVQLGSITVNDLENLLIKKAGSLLDAGFPQEKLGKLLSIAAGIDIKSLQKLADSFGFKGKVLVDRMPQSIYKKVVDAGGLKNTNQPDSKGFAGFTMGEIGAIYRSKTPPVYYIQIKGKGLYHMGENPLNLDVPDISDQKVDFYARITYATSVKDKETGEKMISSVVRFTPRFVKGEDGTLNIENSKYSLDDPKSIAMLINDSPVFVLGENKIESEKTIKKGETAIKNNPDLIPKEPVDLSKDFNIILEESKGIGQNKVYSDIGARKAGRNKGNYKFFMPPGAQDFELLIYNFLGKGELGEKQKKFFVDNLIKPYSKGIAKMEIYRAQLKNDFESLKKLLPEVAKKLGDKIDKLDYTNSQAIRVFLWDKSNFDIPGISKTDKNKLIAYVNKNPELIQFAEGLTALSKQPEWVKPNAFWDTGSIVQDVNSLSSTVGRTQQLQQFIQNAGIIFSKENLNKIEAVYGIDLRESLQDILYRMKNGTNRPSNSDRLTNGFTNWLNNAVGAIMFFNRRSATLQLLSMLNYVNAQENNPLAVAKAVLNVKQYGSDIYTILSSPKIKKRFAGEGRGVNEAEIASAVSTSQNKATALLSYLLKVGFTPTRAADATAIALGGATYYRNKINAYKKQGLSDTEAEAQAWEDFSDTTEKFQQSSDPMLISQQQASILGRFILAFQNTPMQYTRSMIKDGKDFKNRRRIPGLTQSQSDQVYISRIIYYGAVQNFMFAALQNALFALVPGFDDEGEELDEKEKLVQNKQIRIINNMLDTILRGSGIYGAIAATLKNVATKYFQEEGKKPFSKDHRNTLIEILNLSPPVGSKIRKINNALKIKEYDKDVIEKRGWDVTLDGKINLSPSYSVFGNLVEGVTNLPMARFVDEVNILAETLDSRNTSMQRIALGLGWRTWDVSVDNEEHDLIKLEAKADRETARKQKVIDDREERKRLAEEKKYEGKTDEEIKLIKQKDSLIGTNRSEQIKSLLNLGLTKKEIKELKYEDDRVNKIIELTNK